MRSAKERKVSTQKDHQQTATTIAAATASETLTESKESIVRRSGDVRRYGKVEDVAADGPHDVVVADGDGSLRRTLDEETGGGIVGSTLGEESTTTTPGAVPVAGYNSRSRGSSPSPSSSSSPSLPSGGNNNNNATTEAVVREENLVSAVLVEDQDEPVEAELVSNLRKRKWILIVAVCLVVVVSVVAVGAGVGLGTNTGGGGTNDKNDNTTVTMARQWLEADPSYSNYSLERQNQRLALGIFYYATNGNHWYNNTGWLSYGTDECNIDSWYWSISPDLNTTVTDDDSVVCDEEGYIRNLTMINNNLAGTLPLEEISFLLPNITSIDIQNNYDLGGTIPTDIAMLASSLTSLQLSGLKLEGTIPSEIGNLGNLELLNLATNMLSGPIPTTLALLQNLEVLVLRDNQLKKDSDSEEDFFELFDQMSGLHTLDLSYNLLQGFVGTAIWESSSLQAVDISKSKQLIL